LAETLADNGRPHQSRTESLLAHTGLASLHSAQSRTLPAPGFIACGFPVGTENKSVPVLQRGYNFLSLSRTGNTKWLLQK
jgi:hypothetical protein